MREQRLLNNDWKFVHGFYNQDDIADFTQWSDIGLPHSFGIPYFMENDFYVGYGCYAKELILSETDCKKRLLLEFLGSFQVTEVFFNNQLVGTHEGGYTSFVVDLTDKGLVGKNQLFVRVNNLWNAQIAPRGGEHQFNGGIYRDVSLVLTEHSCVDWMGTFVTTQTLQQDKAVLLASIDVLQDAAGVTLQSKIIYEGSVVAHSENLLQPAKRQTVQQQFTVEHPQLWSPETPNLYQMQTTLLVEGKVVDTHETTFGIRTVRFDKDEGFFLNGKHYDILGANVHQDHAGWADAVTRAGITRDIEMIKACGMNFIRGSHYPHHPFFAEECDRIGILFWSELCFWGTGGVKQEGYWTSSGYPVNKQDQAPFEESCIKTLEEMILANRNSPSVITWSMCNEPFFSEEVVMDEARMLVQKLVAYSKELDPTRAVSIGGAQRGDFDSLGDVAGYNGDGASLFIDPGFPSFVSEYGSVCAFRPGAFEPNFTDNVDQQFKWRSGKALWCAFHHGSILGEMGRMGMIDYYRLPLNTWHWYRKHLLDIDPPAPRKLGCAHQLSLTSDTKTITTNGQQDAWLFVEVLDKDNNPLANELEVTLTVVEGDGIFPTGKCITFSPEAHSFLDGQAAIEFRSYYGGINVIEASAEGLVCARICIHAIGEPRKKEVVPMTPPPYVCSAPDVNQDAWYNFAVNKPVFCSDFEKDHSAMHITTKQDTCWKPQQQKEAWVQLDLEGSREVVGFDVVFEHKNFQQDCKILLSVDGKTYVDFWLAPKKGVFSARGKWAFRYLKIMWQSEMGGVSNLKVWIQK